MAYDMNRSRSESLAKLMDDGEAEANWDPAERGKMLGHQLSASIRREFARQSDTLAAELAGYEASGGQVPGRLIDLLGEPAPAVAVLEMLKRVAQENKAHSDRA